MICPKCNSDIKDGSKFCTNCGEPLPKIKKCIQCGAFIKEEALFCTNCGTKQPLKEEKPKVEEVQSKNEVKTENPTPKKEEVPVVKETPKKKVEQPQQKVKKEQPKSNVDSKLSEKVSQSKPISSSKEEEKDSLQQQPKQKQSSKSFKISWSKVLLGIGILSMGIYKTYFKGQDNEEVTSQQYMDFSKSNQLEQKSEKANYITLETFYNDYVFGNKDFSNIAKTICTPRLLQQLKDAYEYECESGDCYAIWLFRSGNQDGISNVSKVISVTDEGEGWNKVVYLDMGIEGATYIRLIEYGEIQLIDEIRRAY